MQTDNEGKSGRQRKFALQNSGCQANCGNLTAAAVHEVGHYCFQRVGPKTNLNNNNNNKDELEKIFNSVNVKATLVKADSCFHSVYTKKELYP
jgi:hypothetical protein